MKWHADTTMLDDYTVAALDPLVSASLEAHLVACADCRTTLAARMTPTAQPRLARVWDDLVDRIDAPVPGPVERILLRLGVAQHTARLLAATPALHGSWLCGVAAVLCFTLVAAHAAPRGVIAFLTLAPLLPLAGVATAYGPGVDPTYEVGLAAPLSSFKLLLIRTTAVLASTMTLAVLAGLALPSVGVTAAAWLLPALALSLGCLALGAVVNPVWACAGLGAGWLAAVLLMAAGRVATAELFGHTAQLTWAVLAAVAAVSIAARRERYETEDGRNG